MEKDINNLYFLLTKHNPFPSNCLPSSEKLNNRGSTKKLLQISRSIADIINRDSDSFYHKKRQSEVRIQNFTNIQEDSSQHPSRIHHNFTHFSKLVAVRTGSLKPFKSDQQGVNKYNFQTLPSKANQTTINTNSSNTGRRKDIYDDHIEKYMSTKFNNEELIQKYLTDRDNFIKEACLDIEKDIKKQYHVEPRSSRKSKMKKYSSHLPKIQQTATHMLKKSTSKINDATYIQEMSQLKRVEELELKDRKRKQKAFKRKMNSLETRINRLKTITQR